MTVNPDLLNALEQARARAEKRSGSTKTSEVLGRVIAALPEAAAHVARVKASRGSLTPQGFPNDPVPTTPTPDAEAKLVTDFIAASLPELEQKVREALADGKIVVPEAMVILTAVSQAVFVGASKLGGATARALVLGIFEYLWDRFLQPALPAWLKPVSGWLYNMLVGGLQLAYDLVVNKPAK